MKELLAILLFLSGSIQASERPTPTGESTRISATPDSGRVSAAPSPTAVTSSPSGLPPARSFADFVSHFWRPISISPEEQRIIDELLARRADLEHLKKQNIDFALTISDRQSRKIHLENAFQQMQSIITVNNTLKETKYRDKDSLDSNTALVTFEIKELQKNAPAIIAREVQKKEDDDNLETIDSKESLFTPGVSSTFTRILDSRFDARSASTGAAAGDGMSSPILDLRSASTGAAAGGGASSPTKPHRRARIHTKEGYMKHHRERGNTDGELADSEIE